MAGKNLKKENPEDEIVFDLGSTSDIEPQKKRKTANLDKKVKKKSEDDEVFDFSSDASESSSTNKKRRTGDLNEKSSKGNGNSKRKTGDLNNNPQKTKRKTGDLKQSSGNTKRKTGDLKDTPAKSKRKTGDLSSAKSSPKSSKKNKKAPTKGKQQSKKTKGNKTKLTKKSKIIILVSALVLCIGVGVGGYFVLSGSSTGTSTKVVESDIYLNLPILTFEYGEEIELTKEDFISEGNQYFDDIEIDYDEDKINEVGEHEIRFLYNDDVIDLTKVIVSDTTAPTFVDFESHLVLQASKSIDLTNYYKAVDRSGDPKITIETEESYDPTVAGMYSVTVKAVDKYNNTKTESGAVEIVEEVDEETVLSSPISEDVLTEYKTSLTKPIYRITEKSTDQIDTDEKATEELKKEYENIGITLDTTSLKTETKEGVPLTESEIAVIKEILTNPDKETEKKKEELETTIEQQEQEVYDALKSLSSIPEWGFSSATEAEEAGEELKEQYGDLISGYNIVEETTTKGITYYYVTYNLITSE